MLSECTFAPKITSKNMLQVNLLTKTTTNTPAKDKVKPKLIAEPEVTSYKMNDRSKKILEERAKKGPEDQKTKKLEPKIVKPVIQVNNHSNQLLL